MSRTIDPEKFLTRAEIQTILDDFQRKAHRSINTRQNRVIFTLATMTGLRVSEVVGINLDDVRLTGDKPNIRIRSSIAKRGRKRFVPIWDREALAILTAWKTERTDQGATTGDPFVCSQSRGTQGKRLSDRNVQHRWEASMRPLCTCGQRDHTRDCRVNGLSIHCGRHSFASHSLECGKSLAQVQKALGHSNITTPAVYLHAVGDDTPPDLFNFAPLANVDTL